MNFCPKCGNKVENNCSFCTKCGMNLINNTNNYNGNNNVVKSEGSSTRVASIVLGILGILGAVLFIFAPISLILSIIGLILGIIATKKCRNVAGIVLSSIGLFISLIMCVLIGMLIYFAFITVDTTYGDYDIPSIYYDDSSYY